MIKHEETLAAMMIASAAMIPNGPHERRGSLRGAIERGADRQYRKRRNKKNRMAKASRKKQRRG